MFSSVVSGTYRKLFIIHSLTLLARSLAPVSPRPYPMGRRGYADLPIVSWKILYVLTQHC